MSGWIIVFAIGLSVAGVTTVFKNRFRKRKEEEKRIEEKYNNNIIYNKSIDDKEERQYQRDLDDAKKEVERILAETRGDASIWEEEEKKKQKEKKLLKDQTKSRSSGFKPSLIPKHDSHGGKFYCLSETKKGSFLYEVEDGDKVDEEDEVMKLLREFE